jgi:hypothetical protein
VQTLNHYLKAIVGGIVAGLTYLMTVLGPAATVGDITLLQWIGFAVSVLGTFGGVAAVTNGPKPGTELEVVQAETYVGRHEAVAEYYDGGPLPPAQG